MHYYQLNIGDYSSHTAHLEPLEDIAYRRMIDIYYLNECPLPEEPEEVGRLIRMRTHCDLIANVLREFFTLQSDGWRHSRIDGEIAKFRDKSDKAKKSAQARWGNKAIKGNANALRPECEGNANHKPLTTNQEPPKEKKVAKRGARLSVEALPDEWETFCREERQDLHPHSVFSRFRDHWIAQPGQKGVKLDWLATWRNWISS